MGTLACQITSLTIVYHLFGCRSKKTSALLTFRRGIHDDVIKWKHFPRYWPFVRGIHRSPVNSPHKGQWHGALMFSLICVWIHGWVNNREAGDLRRYCAHYDVTVMFTWEFPAQMASNAENVSIWWRHHVTVGSSVKSSFVSSLCRVMIQITLLLLWLNIIPRVNDIKTATCYGKLG